MEENSQSQNKNQPQSAQNDASAFGEARSDERPLILPLTDTESYHHLAPSAQNTQDAPIVSSEKTQSLSASIEKIKDEKFPSQKDAIFHIEVDKIKSNPFQPRVNFDEESLKELAASIREFGVIQPIIVVKNEIENETGTQVEYQLIAGERRLKASKIAGLERIPAIVKKISKKADQMEMAIVENLQRADLDSIETARAYARLSDEFGLTQREIAARLGKSRETIANSIRLLNLPTEIQNALAEGKINESQGRLILSIADVSQQMDVYKDLLFNNLSVRELKNKIRRKIEAGNQEVPQTASKVDQEMNHLQEQLIELLGAPVKIDPPAGGSGEEGKIVISFYSSEEIKGIIEKINPKL
ncbi:ParB/RepB/Spo0J family partition protein [Candidatus Wolfebacteria bacterium]|nr:ParB/RepB/Spo0J family partition protein [Candidatus Wolfebacteria bacterium]